MELGEYLRVLRRRWLLIVGTTAVLVGLAAAYTFTATPQYASEARVVVTATNAKGTASSDSAYLNGQASLQRMQTYASLVSDGKLTRAVVDDLGLKISPAALAEQIEAEVVPETSVLTLRVTDDNRRWAARVCEAVTAQLLTMIKDIETPPGAKVALLKGTVVSEPSSSAAPVSPQPARNLAIGLVLGLMLGVGLAIAREMLDSTLKASDDVEEIVGAPMLGGISADPKTVKQPLVSTLSSHAPRVEAFRVLRTNLQFVDIDSAAKAFVVTSSMPGEGKSTTAVNVAITMAQAGQKVLLLDGDLRRPQVANLLDLENVVGVTTVLLGRLPLSQALQTHRASGLHVLASGAIPPNPAELLQSRAMAELLDVLRAEYDVVVIDAPPLLPVTDAALLARQTDGAVVVVGHAQTTKDQLTGAVARLAAVDARVLGAVFNKVKASRGGGGYGYSAGYGYAPEEPVDPTYSRPVADLRPDASVRADGRVAEVLPITGQPAAARTWQRVARSEPAVRVSVPADLGADLEDTGTTGAPRPGRHRG